MGGLLERIPFRQVFDPDDQAQGKGGTIGVEEPSSEFTPGQVSQKKLGSPLLSFQTKAFLDHLDGQLDHFLEPHRVIVRRAR